MIGKLPFERVENLRILSYGMLAHQDSFLMRSFHNQHYMPTIIISTEIIVLIGGSFVLGGYKNQYRVNGGFELDCFVKDSELVLSLCLYAASGYLSSSITWQREGQSGRENSLLSEIACV